eukprot:jgi/Ulvmu1/6662/UM003_0300.1
MARSNHHRDACQTHGELDDTSSGTGLVLIVPRDADTAVLHAELRKLRGLEAAHTDLVRQQGCCIAQFDSQAAAQHAHESILAADSQFGPYRVQCFFVEPGASQQPQNIWSGGPSDHLRLPETLYETGPLTQQMPPITSPRTAFKDPPILPAESASQRGPSSLTSTMTPHSNSTTVGGTGGAPAGDFWSPPLSLTGAAASAPNSSGATNGASSQLAMLAQQRLAQQPGGAQPLFDGTAAGYQLAQMFRNLSTSQDDYPGSGGPHDNGSNPGGGVRGLPSLRSSAFPSSSMLFDSEGIPSTGSGTSGNWPPRVSVAAPSSYPPPNLHPGLTAPACAGLHDLGSGGPSHAYAIPPPPYAPHAQHAQQRNQSSNIGYPMDMLGPASADEYTGPGGANMGGGYGSGGGWPGYMAAAPTAVSGAERSRQRLFVVVSKSATEEQIAKQFKKFGGMEYCNLKRDKRTGASKGYCFVNFSTAESAAAAMKALNGMEFPTGSGKNLRVEYSEVLPSARQGVLPSSRPSSSNSHGSSTPQAAFPQHLKGDGGLFDGHMPSPYMKAMHDARAPRSQEHQASAPQQLSPGRQHGMPQHGMAFGNISDFVAAHKFDPSSGMFAAPSGGHPASCGRGCGTARSRGEAAVAGDPCHLFVHVSPHLPEHAVRHLFEGFGTVVSVVPLEEESCYWVVRYEDAAAAAAATAKLNGSNILGSVLTVEPSDSVNGALRPHFLAVSSISTYSSQYPSSRGASSQGISSTGSMQANAFGGKMMHYYDGRGVGSGGSHFPQHAQHPPQHAQHPSPSRFMPQVMEGGGIRGAPACNGLGGRNGSGSLPSSGHSPSPSPQPGGYAQFQ